MSGDAFVVEENRRLSESMVWRLQRDFYERQGIAAWSSGAVPHYISSNRYLARAYAQVIFGWLRDIAGDVDRSQPVYIVELGAGSGRLAYHFLMAFFDFYESSVLRDIPVVYVMTDYSQSTIEYWRGHEQLQVWVESGRLDFAQFDGDRDDSLTLIHAGETLTAETLRNPLAVVANYIFDSLVQDAFQIKEGQLYESLVTIASAERDPDLADPEALTFHYEHRQITTDYYDDPVFNQLLADYQESLTETNLLFPVGPLMCFNRLLSLSGGRLFVLAGDKGHHRLEELDGRAETKLVQYQGSFSVTLNFDAIERYAVQRGGHFFRADHYDPRFSVCAVVFGGTEQDFQETSRAYDREIVQNSPGDFFSVRMALEPKFNTLALDELLAYIQLNGWDNITFTVCFPALLRHIDDISLRHRVDLYRVIYQVWAHYYHIGEPNDLPFMCAGLLYGLEYFDDAIMFLNHSLRLYGEDGGTLTNMAACYMRLNQVSEALDCINRALAVNPGYEPALSVKAQVEAELKRRQG